MAKNKRKQKLINSPPKKKKVEIPELGKPKIIKVVMLGTGDRSCSECYRDNAAINNMCMDCWMKIIREVLY